MTSDPSLNKIMNTRIDVNRLPKMNMNSRSFLALMVAVGGSTMLKRSAFGQSYSLSCKLFFHKNYSPDWSVDFSIKINTQDGKLLDAFLAAG